MALQASENPVAKFAKTYYREFLIGGITVSAIKFFGNKVSPKWAAVMGALPLGMYSSKTIDDTKRFENYLHNCELLACQVLPSIASLTHLAPLCSTDPIMTCVLLISVGVYRKCYYSLKMARPEALKRAFQTWFVLGLAAAASLLRG